MERLRAVSIEFTSRFAHPCRGKQPLTWKSVVVQCLAPQRELWAAPCQLPARNTCHSSWLDVNLKLPPAWNRKPGSLKPPRVVKWNGTIRLLCISNCAASLHCCNQIKTQGALSACEHTCVMEGESLEEPRRIISPDDIIKVISSAWAEGTQQYVTKIQVIFRFFNAIMLHIVSLKRCFGLHYGTCSFSSLIHSIDQKSVSLISTLILNSNCLDHSTCLHVYNNVIVSSFCRVQLCFIFIFTILSL